jgi:hypothetical protein
MEDGMLALPMPARLSKQATLDALCDTCRNLLIRPHTDIDSEARETYNIEEVRNAAQRGCPICVRLHWSLTAPGQPADTKPKRYFDGILSTVMIVPVSCGSIAPGVKERVISFGNNFRSYFFLGPAMQVDNQLLMLKERSHPIDPYNVPVAESVPSYSGSDTCLARIRSWLEDCDRNHVRCKESASRKSAKGLPARLIDVGSSTKASLIPLDLILDKSSVRYATLSHRWGDKATMPMLMKSNFHEFQQAINLDELPKIFSDAVVMCRHLGLRFLWIDALCLVQDDAGDCEREIANMGEIYTNAHVNFGAIGAAVCPERGLFYESRAEATLPFHVPVHRGGVEMDYLAYASWATNGIGRSVLMSRGWVSTLSCNGYVKKTLISYFTTLGAARTHVKPEIHLFWQRFVLGMLYHNRQRKVSWWDTIHPRTTALLGRAAATAADQTLGCKQRRMGSERIRRTA